MTGQILTGPAITALNTFMQPYAVEPKAFKGARVQGNAVTIALPARSIVILKLEYREILY
ncbi:alpha-L-arabinofuranosidase [Xanthomonas campestris]|nr:alpha-L-arabinofuranosidase [Xanthomonas sp. CFBP 8151]